MEDYDQQTLEIIVIPKLFSKIEGDIVIVSVRLSVMLSSPEPLDEIQPNVMCKLIT